MHPNCKLVRGLATSLPGLRCCSLLSLGGMTSHCTCSSCLTVCAAAPFPHCHAYYASAFISLEACRAAALCHLLPIVIAMCCAAALSHQQIVASIPDEERQKRRSKRAPKRRRQEEVSIPHSCLGTCCTELPRQAA